MIWKSCSFFYCRTIESGLVRDWGEESFFADSSSPGGNGGSAHPSDAIGELAANLMIHDRFPSKLDATPFQLQFADEWGAWMENLTTGW